MSLVEIGPRFVLTPIRIFEGAFGGATVYSNPGLWYLSLGQDCRLITLWKSISRVRLTRCSSLCFEARKGCKIWSAETCATGTSRTEGREEERGGRTGGGQGVFVVAWNTLLSFSVEFAARCDHYRNCRCWLVARGAGRDHCIQMISHDTR